MLDVDGVDYLLAILDRSPMIAFAKDRDGKYFYVNHPWLAVVGRRREEVLGRTDHDLFDRESAEQFVKNDRQVLETGETIEVEEHLRLGDREIVGQSTKFPLRDAEGRVSAVAGFAVDITEHDEARRALARSEQRFRELLEHSPEAYSVLDPATGRIVEANDNVCRMFKMSREQYLGADPGVLSPATQPDGRSSHEAVRHYVGRVLAGETPVFDWIHKAGDGELLPCRIWLAQVDLGGRPGIRASMLDMREIARVRSVLERTRAQLDAVQDALPQLVAVFDPADGSLVHCNRRYEELLGTRPSRPLWQRADEACADALSAGAGRQEVGLVTSQGEQRIIEVEVSVFHRDEHGEPALLLLVGNDVTDQRAMEAQLLQSRKLESMGRLAGGVAHDFNNLLTVILSGADFLKPSLSVDPDALADLASMTRAAEKGRVLTQQLLTFAKKQPGRVEPVAVDEAMRQSLTMLRRLIGEDVSVETDFDAPDCVVMIDRAQLDQVVVNLALNARDAMSGGGTLRIVTRAVSVPEDHATTLSIAAGHYLELSIEDTGSGMSRDVTERAFEPFFTTKQPGRGTGLGLSTVHGVIERAGGHIALDSHVGKGTRVVLLLPAQQGAEVVADENARAVAEPRARRQCRVLVVEDDPDVRRVNVRALRVAGHEVVEAEHAGRALGLVDSGAAFDVLVSDVMMPDMSGLELAEQLRQRSREIEVLLVSGYADEVLAERGVRLEDVNLLRKPFTPSALVARVDDLLAPSFRKRTSPSLERE